MTFIVKVAKVKSFDYCKTDRNGYKVAVWYRPLLFNATMCRIEVSNFKIESLKVTIVYLDLTPFVLSVMVGYDLLL